MTETEPPPLTVFLGSTENTVLEVRAIPVIDEDRHDLQHLAASLRQEIVFSSWRHALAFCDVAGFAVENRNTAELLAGTEELPGMNGPCWICGRGGDGSAG
jgi:hypothetical protein